MEKQSVYMNSFFTFRWKELSILCLIIIASSACTGPEDQEENKSVHILFDSSVEDFAGQLFLEEYRSAGFTLIDSLEKGRHGWNPIRIPLSEPEILALKGEMGERLIFPAIPGDTIGIEGEGPALQEYRVYGSKDLLRFMELRKKTDDFLDSAELLAGWVRDSLGNPDYSKLRLEASRRYQENLDSLRSWYRAFIRENDSSILTIMALQNQVGPGIYVLDPITDYPLYYRVDSLLSSAYPRSKAVIAFNERLDRIQRRKREAYENPRMSVGEKTGNYTLPGKNGKPFTLLDESSALILLDFRNSLCKPCDRNDSLYRKILDTYENRQLRLYQVYLNPPNINQHAEKPVGIPQNWDIVYAQQGWDSEIIRNTGITKVPANFLLKGNGLILEKDIFGDELEQMLKNLNASL